MLPLRPSSLLRQANLRKTINCYCVPQKAWDISLHTYKAKCPSESHIKSSKNTHVFVFLYIYFQFPFGIFIHYTISTSHFPFAKLTLGKISTYQIIIKRSKSLLTTCFSSHSFAFFHRRFQSCESEKQTEKMADLFFSLSLSVIISLD